MIWLLRLFKIKLNSFIVCVCVYIHNNITEKTTVYFLFDDSPGCYFECPIPYICIYSVAALLVAKNGQLLWLQILFIEVFVITNMAHVGAGNHKINNEQWMCAAHDIPKM